MSDGNQIPVARVESHELVKHTGAIHISNKLTLMQRKCSNVLLHNAFESLLTEERHVIRISDLCKQLGLSTNNHDALKSAIRALAGTQIEWNIFGRDKKHVAEWTVTSILASAQFKNGICEYTYSPHLRELLHSPNIFARLNLQVQKGFGSKHAIALWEYLVSELCVRQADQAVVSDYLLVEQFRDLMGLGEGEYQEFRDLNKFVIKAAIAEINEVSDIEAKVEYKREGRKVVALRFIAERKDRFQLPLDLEGDAAMGDGLVTITTPETITEIVGELVTRQVTSSTAEKFVKEYPVSLIEFQIEHYDYLVSIGKEPTSGGWWRSALKDNYQPPRGFKSKAERKAEQMREQLLVRSRRAFQDQAYEDAISFAESCLKYGSLPEAEKIREEAHNALASDARQQALEAYKASLSDEDMVQAEQEAEQRIRQRGGVYLQEFQKDGMKSIFFTVSLDEILTERLQQAVS